MTKLGPGGLVPPRPNLGPEPWRQPPSAAGGLLAVAALGCLLVGWLIVYRLRSRRRRLRPKTHGWAHEDRPEGTPRERLVGLSNSVREALSAQYGSTWRAKTTKELADDARLVQAVGSQGFADLIRFLDQVDHLKFAPERHEQYQQSLQQDLMIWEPLVVALIATIRDSSAGRRQRTAARSI